MEYDYHTTEGPCCDSSNDFAKGWDHETVQGLNNAQYSPDHVYVALSISISYMSSFSVYLSHSQEPFMVVLISSLI